MPDHHTALSLSIAKAIIEKTIPGAVPAKGREVVYFCDDGRSSKRSTPFNARRRQFNALTGYVKPPYVQNGGAYAYACSLGLPDGSTFHAVEYHGDLAAWRQTFEEASAGLKVALARVEGDKFVISDGRVFALSDCTLKLD